MCGRTACTLAPDTVVRACGFRNKKGTYQRPVWKDPPGGQQYYPSYNVAPASHTPVLLSSRHYPDELESLSERVVQPMKWGLVPSWHKGDPYKLEYETNNCRAEGMLTKRTYKSALEKGNRCVILADGFFEWKRGKEGKQPYFIYFPQNSPDTKPDLKPFDKLDSSPKAVKSESQLPSAPAASYTHQTVSIKPDPDSLDRPIKKEEPDSQPAASSMKNEIPWATSSSGKAPPLKEELKEEVSVTIKKERDWEAGDCKTDEMTGKCITSDESAMKTQLMDDLTSVKNSRTGDLTQTEEEEWQGKRLLTIAGVFDVWHPPDGSAPLYSYSVITVEASPAMSWIHHRMPAILSTEEEISNWLDFAEVPLSKAVKAIRPTECIAMHMVSPVVNNSRNKSSQCVELYNPKEVKKTASSNFMMSWLNKSKSSAEPQSSPAKKHKPQ